MLIRKKNKFFKVLLLFAIIGTGILTLLYLMNNYLVFFFTPSEVLNNQNLPKNFRIGGIIKEVIYIENSKTQFFIVDENLHKNKIQVIFEGHLLPMFNENQGVVVEGHMNQNHFLASKLFIKHDEVYKPKK